MRIARMPMTREEAQHHADRAWFVTGVSAGLNCVIAAVWLLVGGGRLAGMSPWLIVLNGVCLFGLGYGVHRSWRSCGVVLVLAFAVDAAYKLIVRGPSAGLAITLVFGYFYVQGLRGAIAYRRITGGAGERADFGEP